MPLWTRLRNRRATFGKNWVGENVVPTDLNQRGGMPNPRHGEVLLILAEKDTVIVHDRKMILLRFGRRLAIPPITLPFYKISETMAFKSGIGIAKDFALMMRNRIHFSGVFFYICNTVRFESFRGLQGKSTGLMLSIS